MSSTPQCHLPPSRARRHFLGVIAATSARLVAMSSTAAMISALPAQAKPKEKHGNGPKGGGHNCFLRGTSISTPKGSTHIEDLKIGDFVETVRGEAVAIKWIGRRAYKMAGPSWNDSVMPIRISRHAIDDRTPHSDLYLSPNHALLIDGVLIRVKELVNGISIVPALPTQQEKIEYLQIVLDTHEVILAEGAPAESFLLRGSNHENFTNFAEFERLYPGHSRLAMTPFAPIVGYEGGREHLRALLGLGISRFVQVHDPIQEAYTRIAARTGQLVN
ncbi:Hint domain-containing protein [Phyllobacterium sp. KW56]|nr:Hint domain-containing protein [Phyllobacterium sp. KW56]MBZ9605290.1 Hint domain-containing protein [Phyllobacterium sp. KW56]